MKCLCLVLTALVSVNCYTISENEIVETSRLQTSEELLDSVISDCFQAESTSACLKAKVLSFLDTKLGVPAESARAFDGENIDKVIFDRVGRVLETHEFRFQLPEFLFQSAEVSYRADRGFDVDIPESNDENGEGSYLFLIHLPMS